MPYNKSNEKNLMTDENNVDLYGMHPYFKFLRFFFCMTQMQKSTSDSGFFSRRLPGAHPLRDPMCTLGVLCHRLRVVDPQTAKRAREARARPDGGERQQPMGTTSAGDAAAAQGQPGHAVRARQAHGFPGSALQQRGGRGGEGGGRAGARGGVVQNRGQASHPKVL